MNITDHPTEEGESWEGGKDEAKKTKVTERLREYRGDAAERH